MYTGVQKNVRNVFKCKEGQNLFILNTVNHKIKNGVQNTKYEGRFGC